MQLFYSENIQENRIVLEEDEFHHLKVLRKKEGDIISVTDGNGHLYSAEIKNIAKHSGEAVITATQTFDKPVTFPHIVVAPTKNTDRMEWMVEKLVEIGVSEISFIQCEHSERKIIKTDRLKKIALSAMKQSLKYYLPVINELTGFKTFITTKRTGNLFIGYCEAETTEFLPRQPFTAESTLVLIGPEGDFAPQEVEMAKAAGFMPVSLGQSRLRTETAAMVAATLINAKFEGRNDKG
ncbi:MAG TPA: 16S rRNA (uracil(1498)-N(3))-methyltransferase [Bacteroidia bacterium]|nr:16S rRNA (uracil(1498)-N(3))-methyltransferase [Bacteroidia bacterium]